MKKIIIILLILLALTLGLLFYIKITKSVNRFSITFFNVGQGDAALIKFNNGEKMLVDCGADRQILSKLGRALPFYDRTLDYLVVSHPDLDHYGGCAEALKRYNVKNILINGEKKYDSYFSIWEKALAKEGARLETINISKQIKIASSVIDFFAPDESLPAASALEGNNQSIVFRISYQDKSYFFAGDMEVPLEIALMQKYCSSTTTTLSSKNCPALKSGVLKVGHHGSDSSSGEEFLDALCLEKAIISVGKNSFGHPSLRTLKKLQRAGVQILRTDQLGDLSS